MYLPAWPCDIAAIVPLGWPWSPCTLFKHWSPPGHQRKSTDYYHNALIKRFGSTCESGISIPTHLHLAFSIKFTSCLGQCESGCQGATMDRPALQSQQQQPRRKPCVANDPSRIPQCPRSTPIQDLLHVPSVLGSDPIISERSRYLLNKNGLTMSLETDLMD
ncbi:hypothetical protein GQ44DRAFT_716857 [Phaeosphaeriaceae sp. PMI808]|nr:hypothetical protein GQ44DRAFT_716857 [Phaeosphaeriaceae sp. PMI808]